jgi:hypothetical protein
MNDSIKSSGGGGAVSSSRISSGAKVTEKKIKSSEQAVDRVVSDLGKTKESIERLSEAATTRIEVVKQNESSSRTRVEDLDEAIRLSKDLRLNIKVKEDQAKAAHDRIRTAAAKELLK